MAKDFFGTEIKIGDEVAFMEISYRNLLKGTIKSISPKMVTITHEKTNWGRTETRQEHNQVIVRRIELVVGAEPNL